MTPERFADLAEAYGGRIARWPAHEQAQARAHLRERPEADAVLQAAGALDAALAGWTVPGPGSALAARIAAGRSRRRPQVLRLRLWFSGLGTAAALAGGVAAGAGVVALSMPAPDQAGVSLYAATALGPLPDAVVDVATGDVAR